MARVRSRMLVFPVFELLLFLCTTGLSHALRVHDKNESPVARHPRAVLDNQLEFFSATTIPNHLPEEAEDPRLLYTLSPFITTADSRTISKTNQLLSSLVTTTVAPSPKTMDPTVKLRDASVTTTLATGIHNLTSPLLTSPPKNSTTPTTADYINNSRTVFSSPAPPLSTEKASQCNCSVEGTVDPDDCSPLTGHCICLPGYSGPQCQECEHDYFTNGTSGCVPCACDSHGSTNLSCNSSGVCVCKVGVSGDKCDDCHPGFYGFSSAGCQPCQCNNHTSHCDTQSGICLNCQGNTRGPNCEQCKYNFYRESGAGPNDTCLPCPCSSVTSSGSCTLDSSGQPVCDQCQPGYKGPNCEQCRDGFYNADSICVPCDCSGNAAPDSAPRICHPDTGLCLNCSNSTTGTRCQSCAPGFHGHAIAHNCTRIVLPTPEFSTTMTPSPNVTELQTSPTTLLSSLATTNGTAGPGAASTEFSWGQFNIIVLAVIIVVLVALMGVAAGTYAYREYQNRKLNAPFWTIELKEDNISFSSYHDSLPNADVSGLLEDEACDMSPTGQLTLSGSGNLYKV
ncbi:LOW QUALITY PROTEIN: multiple epidermal growth factor-like domains protein 9 [Brachyhypopomus gauderio]|uniref:LOW QUALITY PROTEIN: multiple epidermal growth factor-like domains protein 9 n=1 Tax=Brachyhypopomus gauderio TaxID=698409 RepID=UPI0040435C04